MQKSAHPPAPARERPADSNEPTIDKGQKFEPFFIPAAGRGRRSVARELKLDQRR